MHTGRCGVAAATHCGDVELRAVVTRVELQEAGADHF